MKRMFALIVAICMLLSVSAYAENAAVPGLQDELPPKVYAENNVAAKIIDKDGNVLAEIPDDGTLELTDVHLREQAADESVAARLTASYDAVMKDVHFSDVACKLHDHVVKADVNDALAAMLLDAYDLVMFELYDVALNDSNAALLTDGACLEVTFELADGQPQPLIVLFSEDGQAWQIIDSAADGNRFTVKLEQPGVLALMSSGRDAMISSDIIVTDESSDATTDKSSDNFTPSVTGKPAPSVIPFTKDGETYVAAFTNGTDVIPVPAEDYIIITSVAERDYIADIQTHEHLEWGYNSILDSENVGELLCEEGAIADLLDQTLAQLGSDLTHSDLVVKDLFEITAYGDYVEYLYDDAYALDITLDTNLNPEDTAVVIHSADSKNWHIHPISEFAIGADGSINLKLYDLGVVALLVEASEAPVNAAGAVTSPN